MRGDRFLERQEPDRGLPLLAVVAVERVEDFLRGLGRAEDLVQQGSRLLLEGELGQRLAGAIAGAGGLERGRCVDRGERRRGLAVLQGREQFLGLLADAGIDRVGFRRTIVGGERLLRRLLGRRPDRPGATGRARGDSGLGPSSRSPRPGAARAPAAASRVRHAPASTRPSSRKAAARFMRVMSFAGTFAGWSAMSSSAAS